MPFERVNEHVVRERRVKVCARCRRPMDEAVQHRGAWNTAGSVGGSLGTSIGGSMLVGSLLGPVGAIGGALAGAVVGSRAGAAASDAACDAVEACADDVCERCKEESARRPAQKSDWGGGRLGSVDEVAAPSSGSYAGAPPAQQGEPSAAGKVGEAAAAAGETLGRAASATGETLSRGWSSLSRSVSATFGGSEEPAAPRAGRTTDAVPFSGSGHVLGSGAPVEPRPVSRLVGGPQAPPPGAPAPAAARSQVDQDEALARQLQQQFDQEGR